MSTKEEIEKKQQELNAEVIRLKEQAVMVGCPDRKCRMEGCEKLGIYVVAGCRINDRFDKCNFDSDALKQAFTHFASSDRCFSVGKEAFHPLYFLCWDHLTEQKRVSGGIEYSDNIREKLWKGAD